jgi:hydrophobic/amphiphilic exporter-1 (mainly G- bacteria), HAE1 family
LYLLNGDKLDFAREAERKEGKAPAFAIREACLLRFRPMMMTTLAAMMGAMPIAIGIGAGAELRQPMGVAVSRRLGAIAAHHPPPPRST